MSHKILAHKDLHLEGGSESKSTWADAESNSTQLQAALQAALNAIAGPEAGTGDLYAGNLANMESKGK
jgi:hypothetical protein